jgi:hypothetical protein
MGQYKHGEKTIDAIGISKKEFIDTQEYLAGLVKWKDLPKINIADIKKKLSLADYRVVATIIVVIAKKLTEHLCSYNSARANLFYKVISLKVKENYRYDAVQFCTRMTNNCVNKKDFIFYCEFTMLALLRKIIGKRKIEGIDTILKLIEFVEKDIIENNNDSLLLVALLFLSAGNEDSLKNNIGKTV